MRRIVYLVPINRFSRVPSDRVRIMDARTREVIMVCSTCQAEDMIKRDGLVVVEIPASGPDNG